MTLYIHASKHIALYILVSLIYIDQCGGKYIGKYIGHCCAYSRSKVALEGDVVAMVEML